MKILISHVGIFKKAGWGRVFPLAAGLAKMGNQVTILTTNPEFSILIKKLYIKDVNILIFPEVIPKRISKMGFGFLSLILKIRHVIFNRYDIVHSDNGHRPLSGMPCRINKRIYGSIYVAEWYDWYGEGGQFDTKKKLFKILLGRYELKYEIKDKKIADGIVVLSEVLRLRAESIKPTRRIIKIHGGADVSVIPFLYDNSQLKAKYGINSDTFTFGYINSESYRLAEFLPLINALKQNGLLNKVKILIIGESDMLIKQLPDVIKDQIVFFGWLDFLQDFEKLQLVDVFFLFKEEILGNRSGWPNCIGDYLACGRPVLLNPVGEVIDFAAKYPFAFIETTRAEDDINNKIRNIIDNKSSIQERGPKIRKLAEDVISWEKKSEALFDFYKYLSDLKKEDRMPSLKKIAPGSKIIQNSSVND